MSGGFGMTFEIAMSVGGSFLALINVWLLFAVQMYRNEIRELRRADKELGEKLAAIQVLVAGNYVTRDEFRDGLNAQTRTILGRMEDLAKRYIVKGSD